MTEPGPRPWCHGYPVRSWWLEQRSKVFGKKPPLRPRPTRIAAGQSLRESKYELSILQATMYTTRSSPQPSMYLQRRPNKAAHSRGTGAAIMHTEEGRSEGEPKSFRATSDGWSVAQICFRNPGQIKNKISVHRKSQTKKATAVIG